MFGIGWTELLIIAIVAIVVVGPKDLPRLMRTFGHYAGKLRRMGNEFKQQVDEAMREAELVEVRKASEIPCRMKPYVNSEARTPVVLERAALRPRRTRRKAGGASSPEKRTASKCRRSVTP